MLDQKQLDLFYEPQQMEIIGRQITVEHKEAISNRVVEKQDKFDSVSYSITGGVQAVAGK